MNAQCGINSRSSRTCKKTTRYSGSCGEGKLWSRAANVSRLVAVLGAASALIFFDSPWWVAVVWLLSFGVLGLAFSVHRESLKLEQILTEELGVMPAAPASAAGESLPRRGIRGRRTRVLATR